VSRAWWGDFAVESGATRLWRIGPLRIWATRQLQEWRVTMESAGEAEEAVVAAEPDRDPGPGAATLRFGFRRAAGSIRLLPATADRAVVVAAASPFFIPAGEEVALFVSTPLWLQIGTAASRDVLRDVPLERPSDTWFGPTKWEGEFCYAAKTAVRLRLENLPLRPHRAVSVVRIRNRARAQLGLARLRLPLPTLSLYGTPDGQLWTDSMTLDWEHEGAHAAVKLQRGAPPEAKGAVRVSGARQPFEPGLLVRTFGGLFGREGATRE
jgi:hypothetical protein